MGHNYYPEHLWSNKNLVVLEGNKGVLKEEYAPNIIHKKTLQFIEQNKDKPFFIDAMRFSA